MEVHGGGGGGGSGGGGGGGGGVSSYPTISSCLVIIRAFGCFLLGFLLQHTITTQQIRIRLTNTNPPTAIRIISVRLRGELEEVVLGTVNGNFDAKITSNNIFTRRTYYKNLIGVTLIL